MLTGMAVAGGIAVLSIAAGLMAPPGAAPPGQTRAPATRSPALAPHSPAADSAALHTVGPGPTSGEATAALHSALPALSALPVVDPTAVLAHVVPQPVPLARSHRNPPTAPAQETAAPVDTAGPQVVSTNGRGVVDARDGRGLTVRAELTGARISESDLGLRLLPGSRPVADSGRRVPDGAGGESLSLALTATGTLESATQFYRRQWQADGVPAGAVQLLQPTEGQVLLRAPSPHGGERSVWILQNGDALEVVLARVRPGPGTPP